VSLDAQINFGNVVAGSPAKPAPINGTYFYARWTGFLCPTVSGVYTLGLNVQDGAARTPVLPSTSGRILPQPFTRWTPKAWTAC